MEYQTAIVKRNRKKQNKGWIILNERKRMQTIDAILSAGNLTQACRQVIRNKGAGGVDAMSVKELKPYLDKNRDELTERIRQGNYYAQPIRGKEILIIPTTAQYPSGNTEIVGLYQFRLSIHC